MSCTIISPVAYQQSRWIAAWNPVRYTVHSNRWPVNTYDDVDVIYSISNENGFARVVLTATAETYIAKEYIKISGSTVAAYNGVWQIRTVNSSTDLTLSCAYTSNATGDFQRYYNNYNLSVQIYTGIRSGHALAADRPMTLRGTMYVQPDTAGDAIIDVSDYVRNDLSPIENQLCESLISGEWYGNDTNMFTQFYIAVAESYDVSDGDTVTTYTGTYVDDMIEPDEPNIFSAANSANQFLYFQGRSMGEYAVADIDPEGNPAKFMTPFPEATYFDGKEFDLSIIIAYTSAELTAAGVDLQILINQYTRSGSLVSTTTDTLAYQDEGVYRFALSEYSFNASTDYVLFKVQNDNGDTLSETQRVNINRTECSPEGMYLRWINPNGGWDAWFFSKNMDRSVQVDERTTVERDIYQDWDNYFSRTGTTQSDYIQTRAFTRRTIRSSRVTKDEADALRWIKTSPKVQEVYLDNSVSCGSYRHRTVLLDSGELKYRSDAEKYLTYELGLRYSDEIITQGQ